jgi:hypothetical protein
MKGKIDILAYLDSLIADGEALLKAEFPVATSSYTKEGFVPLEEYRRWYGNCAVLRSRMGRALAPWEEALTHNMPNKTVVAMALLGTVRSIRDAVDGDHLVSFEDLVVGEVFSSFLDQAQYLHEKGYFIAAGVIARSVLEEELRQVCERESCMPDKERPTLSDFNVSLYKANVYDKVEFKLIDTLTAIGNECAHALPSASAERVSHMIEQLMALLPRIRA